MLEMGDEAGKDIEFVCKHQGFGIFIYHSQRTLFAVPLDKIGPDTPELEDEEIILGPGLRHVRLLIDARGGGEVPLKRCAECRHREVGRDGGHCYMFETEPAGDRCGQFEPAQGIRVVTPPDIKNTY